MAYTCPTCHKSHECFEASGACCGAGYVECPLSELPPDAEFGSGQGKYSYGTIFTGRWELVLNGTPHDEPVRVYPLPLLVSKMVMTMFNDRYQQGVAAAKCEIRHALGI